MPQVQSIVFLLVLIYDRLQAGRVRNYSVTINCIDFVLCGDVILPPLPSFLPDLRRLQRAGAADFGLLAASRKRLPAVLAVPSLRRLLVSLLLLTYLCDVRPVLNYSDVAFRE